MTQIILTPEEVKFMKRRKAEGDDAKTALSKLDAFREGVQIPTPSSDDVSQSPQAVQSKIEELLSTGARAGTKLLNNAPLIGGITSFGESLRDAGVGSLKTGLELVRGTSELGEKAIRSTLSAPFKAAGQKPPKSIAPVPEGKTAAEQLIPNSLTSKDNLAQQAGGLLTELALFIAPSSKILQAEKALTGSKLLTTLFPKTAKGMGAREVIAAATAEAALSGGGTALLQGEINEDVATAALLGAAFQGTARATGKLLDSKRLVRKALGLTPTKSSKIDKIAREAGFDDLSDYVIKRKFRGGRDNILDFADKRFGEVSALKPKLLENVDELTENTFEPLFEHVRKVYDQPGQEVVMRQLDDLASKTKLTATELDQIRYWADQTLPANAYSGEEAIKAEGIQKLIDPIRRRLEQLDKTGTLRSVNGEKRILYKLLPELARSANKDILQASAFRNMGRVLSGGAITSLAPILQPFVIAAGLVDAATDFPQVAGSLAPIARRVEQGAVSPVLQRVTGGVRNLTTP